MSGQATGWVLRHGPHPEHVDREGKPYGARARGLRSVLTCVADAANADGKHAHPGIEGVMRGSLYSRRQSINLLDELVQEGWLGVEEVGGGIGKATVYWLPKMVAEKGATTALNAGQTVQFGEQTVQFEAQTVQSGVHPNGLPNGKSQRSRPEPFPDAFQLTPEMKAWATKEVPGVDLSFQTRQFADHWRGKGEKRADWVATWRTWMRNAKQWNRGSPAPTPPPDPLPITGPVTIDPDPDYDYEAWMDEHDPKWREREARGVRS